MMKDLAKKYLPIIVALLVLIVVWFSSSASVSRVEEQVRSVQSENASIRSEIEVKRAAVNSDARDSGEKVSGLKTARRKADDEKITEVMETATTWSSSGEYEKARSELTRLGVDEKSSLLTEFMPPLEKAADGEKSINRIDEQKLNSRFISIQPFLMRSSAGDNTYFAIVEIAVESATGSQEKNRMIPVSYRLDPNGEFSDLSVQSLWDAPVASD